MEELPVPQVELAEVLGPLVSPHIPLASPHISPHLPPSPSISAPQVEQQEHTLLRAVVPHLVRVRVKARARVRIRVSYRP